MPTASEMIVQTLEEAGVEYVFGIPGGGTGQIFQLLYGREDRIKTILVRHEQAAAIMADAYGRATGKPRWSWAKGCSSDPTPPSASWRPCSAARPCWCSPTPPTAAQRSGQPTSRAPGNTAASTCPTFSSR